MIRNVSISNLRFVFFDEMRKQKLKLKEIEEKKTPFLEQPLKKLNLGGDKVL